MYLNTGTLTYTVKPGDTLYSVARRLNTTPAQLAQANPHANPYRIAAGLVLKLPPTSPAAVPAAAPATTYQPATSALRDEMRTLWEQHVWWTRELIISITAALPDESDVTWRLLMNPGQIAALFAPKFGADAAAEISRLLTEHLAIGAELIHAAQNGDAAAFEDANTRWYQNADQIAAALGGLGYGESEMRAMLYRHLDLTKEEVSRRIAGEYPQEIAVFDEIERQALQMADMLTAGILDK